MEHRLDSYLDQQDRDALDPACDEWRYPPSEAYRRHWGLDTVDRLAAWLDEPRWCACGNEITDDEMEVCRECR